MTRIAPARCGPSLLRKSHANNGQNGPSPPSTARRTGSISHMPAQHRKKDNLFLFRTRSQPIKRRRRKQYRSVTRHNQQKRQQQNLTFETTPRVAHLIQSLLNKEQMQIHCTKTRGSVEFVTAHATSDRGGDRGTTEVARRCLRRSAHAFGFYPQY